VLILLIIGFFVTEQVQRPLALYLYRVKRALSPSVDVEIIRNQILEAIFL